MTSTWRPGTAATRFDCFPALRVRGDYSWRRVQRVQGVVMTERVADRPGLKTGGEDAAWNALRERVVISLRPIGAPTSIGFFGLAAASLTLTGLQLGWVSQVEGKHLALVLIGFVFLAQLLAAIFGFLGRDGTAAAAIATVRPSRLVGCLVLYTSTPG